MPYDPVRHHRRSIRLEGYDYSRAGLYFVTICVQDRLCTFGEIAADSVALNDAGRLVASIWEALPEHYPGVGTDAFVLMPNHLHGIVILEPDNAGLLITPRSVRPSFTLSEIVNRFKTLTTKRYSDGVKEQGWPSFPGRLWQRGFFEHVIRNEKSLNDIRRYIDQNPSRWSSDRENPAATVRPEEVEGG
jgi:REP element-mobilizing transposase RayT